MIPEDDAPTTTSGFLKSNSRRGSRRFEVEENEKAQESEEEKSLMELPETKIKRRGSKRYKSQRKKDKNRPYPKKKGRKFGDEEGENMDT